MNKIDIASRYSVMLLAFFIPISTGLMGVFFAITILLIWLSGDWREKFNFIIKNPMVFWVMLLFAMYVVGMFYSSVSWHERFWVLTKYHKFLLVPLVLPVFMDEKTREWTLKAFMLSILIVTVISYLKFFQWLPLPEHFGMASVFKNHSTANLLTAFGAYLWLHQGLAVKKYRYYALLIGSLLVINALFLSEGRIGYFVVLALVMLLGYQHFSWRGLLASLLICAVLVGLAMTQSAAFKMRVDRIKDYQHTGAATSVNTRAYQAKVSWNIIKQHPIWGVGTGSLAQSYQQTSAVHDSSDNVQSQYLQTWIEIGAVGLILLLLLLAQQVRWGFHLNRSYQYIAIALVVTQAISFLTLVSWMDTTESHFFALFIALCFAGLTRNPSREK